jgi:hypothetical protein
MEGHMTAHPRVRGIVRASKGPPHATFPAYPDEDLKHRGGRTLREMHYKTFYVGAGWSHGALASARQKLDAALAAAMTDPKLNTIVGQYFTSAAIAAIALPSALLDAPARPGFDRGDIQGFAAKVHNDGGLAGIAPDSCVLNFVLPPGAKLSTRGGQPPAGHAAHHGQPGMPEEDEGDSLDGLGGYHGSCRTGQPLVTLYYAAAVWSDGDNGIPVRGWAPWENVCATLYHELQEVRTNPDFEEANHTGNPRLLGWTSDSGNEIGDFPVTEAGPHLELVFKRVPVAAPPHTAPIQLMWSNRVHGPEAP